MVILTQDKKHLINFDNITMIEFHGAAKLVAYFHNSSVPQLLGEYHNADRALVVLKEIYNCFDRDWEAEAHGDGYANTKLYFSMPKTCYEMPEV